MWLTAVRLQRDSGRVMALGLCPLFSGPSFKVINRGSIIIFLFPKEDLVAR